MFHVKHLVLQLPGWLGSGSDHWQSLWAKQYGDQWVEQLDWQQPLRGDWQIALQEHMWAQQIACGDRGEPPVRFVLVGHSLGCHLISIWAHYSPHVDWVAAALLVAPPDLLNRKNLDPALQAWSPPVLERLPFPSVVVSSDNDPHASMAATQDMVQAWGSRHHSLSGLGHLNAASGLGDWPQGRDILNELLNSVEEKEAKQHGH